MKLNDNTLVLVIEAPERRKSLMGAQLKSLEIEFTSVSGIFFDSFPDFFSRERSWAKSRRRLTLPELGCAASHLEAYRLFLDSESQFAVIFEDDATFENIGFFTDQLKNFEQFVESRSFVISFYSKSATLRRNKLNGLRLFRVVKYPSHAVAYLITKEAARILLECNEKLDFVADWPKASGVDFFLTTDRMILHGSETSQSLIEDQRQLAVLSPRKRLSEGLVLVSGIHYLKNKIYFENFKEYFTVIVIPVLLWRFTRLCSAPVASFHRNVRKTLF